MIINRLFIFFFGITSLCLSCGIEEDINTTPEVTSVLDTDAFDEANEVEYTLADGFIMDLWAPGPLLANAVSLSFDHHGNAYVSETQRRKSSDLDIRQHRDWMIEDIGLGSIEDTKALHLSKLATSLSDENTWQKDFNEDGIYDYRDLEVQSEIIRKIYDTDGDGKADASHVYADGINNMVSGVAAGVLYHAGDVFVTAAPDVYRFRDTDDDGDYDTKEIISTGYGIHIAYAGHDMSGLTVGPDGKIYWSIGDLGLNVVDQTGKRWNYPNQGAVMRCNPDGSDFQVYAHGLRNPQEISFDAYGNLISVDNDGDHVGERERYVHIVEGSDAGWRINWQYGKYNYPNEEYKIWMDEGLYLPYFDGQPAYITPAIALAADGPAGLAYNPGTALGEEWNNYFFASYFTGNSKRSKLQAFKLAANGASFKLAEEMDIVNGINSTGVNFGPDGGLYINDWKASYDKKEAGRIWKLDVKNKNPQRDETKSMLQKGAGGISVEILKSLLDHADMRVRQMAQFELVDRKEKTVLLDQAKNAKTLFGQLHAVWGYGQLMRADASISSDLILLLGAEDENVRSQVAKVIGDANYKDAYQALIVLLDDESVRVQFYVAEALGKIGNPKAFDKLVAHLANLREDDPHHRHAIIHALSKLDDGTLLAALSNHKSEKVRISAVVALRELGSARVSTFLKDESALVVTEAARAINDDFSIPDGLQTLAQSLTSSTIEAEAFLRRAINANLRVGDAASADRLKNYFLDISNTEAMRKDALWALGSMANPLVLDRVDGRYRELKSVDESVTMASIAEIFNTIESQNNTAFKALIIQVAGKLGYLKSEGRLFSYVKDSGIDKSLRIASMAALAELESDKLTDAINIIIEDTDVDLRKEAQKIIDQAGFSDDTKIQIIDKILTTGTVEEKQSALNAISNIKANAAITLLKDQIRNIKNLEPEIMLDVISAARNQQNKSLDEALAKYESSKPLNDKLAQYQEAIAGGNLENGKNIFANDESAQCLRCHQIQGYGGVVGPALDKIGSMLSREDLLLSLVAPNVRIAPGYGNTYYTLNDGRELVGTVVQEKNDQLTIRDAAGDEHTFKTTDVKSKENMPSGMISQENILDKFEIRDLVEFLSSLKT